MYQINPLLESKILVENIAERLALIFASSGIGALSGAIHGDVTDSDVLKVIKQKDPKLYYQMKQDRRIKHMVYGALAGLGIGIHATKGY